MAPWTAARLAPETSRSCSSKNAVIMSSKRRRASSRSACAVPRLSRGFAPETPDRSELRKPSQLMMRAEEGTGARLGCVMNDPWDVVSADLGGDLTGAAIGCAQAGRARGLRQLAKACSRPLGWLADRPDGL